MNQLMIDDHILPRPVERLPEYAHAKARQTLADRLIDAFGLSDASASAIANAVVDPSEVRKTIGEPHDPDVEKIPVPGGTLFGIRTSVWARRIMPDPRNPRTLPSRRHPFAIDPGTGGEDSKFRPVPEPHSLNRDQPGNAELAVDIENREHLTWAAQHAAGFVLAQNNWTESIASQGVMEEVWLVATTYQHQDGSEPVTTLTTAEGSSRATAVHSLLSVRSADVAYDDNEAKFRAHIKKLNEAYDRGERGSEIVVALRCERIPALILLGFKPHVSDGAGFPTAVKSLVALRHVDPPTAWGPGPENESLADEVLDELFRRDLISSTEHDYFAGSCTRAEAVAAHLPSDPAMRAAQIVGLFTSKDERVVHAIRVAVTSQSTRKRTSSLLKIDLATALILRAMADEPNKVDQVRRYLRQAVGKAARNCPWEATGRDIDQLVKGALAEVREAIGNGSTEEPGPTSLELAVRAAYPLVVSGRLNADRGSAGNVQPDRRAPGEVLDAMRRSIHGIHQLGQALRDYANDTPIRAVDEEGVIRRLADGAADQLVDDIYLRNEFPPPGKAKASPNPGDTPTDRFENALEALGAALGSLDQAFSGLTKVVGHDGQPIVDARGVEPRLTDTWRELLSRVEEEMGFWARTYRKKYGTKTETTTGPTQEDEGEDIEEFDDIEESAEGDWETEEPGENETTA